MFWPLGPDSTLQVFMATQMSNIVQLRHMLMLNLWVTDDYLITYRTLCVTGGSPTQEFFETPKHSGNSVEVAEVRIQPDLPLIWIDPENHWVWTWFLYTPSCGHLLAILMGKMMIEHDRPSISWGNWNFKINHFQKFTPKRAKCRNNQPLKHILLIDTRMVSCCN